MDNIGIAIVALFVFLTVIFFVAVISGLFIWLLWPAVIPAVLPGLVASGAVAAELSFWKSMLLGLLSSALFKSTSVNNKQSN